MEKQKENALIVVKQLPIIEEQLKTLSSEIDKKVANAKSLIVSDTTVKEVKKVRAELNNEFKELEAQRKTVKEKVLAPYQAFEEVYKSYVSDKYKQADADLKAKIDEVENEQKATKKAKLKEYYLEYAESKGIDWLKYDKYFNILNLNVTLTASEKSLKEEIKNYVDMVVSDLSLIDTQEYSTEILLEYKEHLNVSLAIQNTLNRHKQIEEIMQLKNASEESKKAEEKAIEKVDEALTAPKEVEKIYTMTFKVSGTMEQLKGIKKYLESVGIKYE